MHAFRLCKDSRGGQKNYLVNSWMANCSCKSLLWRCSIARLSWFMIAKVVADRLWLYPSWDCWSGKCAAQAWSSSHATQSCWQISPARVRWNEISAYNNHKQDSGTSPTKLLLIRHTSMYSSRAGTSCVTMYLAAWNKITSQTAPEIHQHQKWHCISTLLPSQSKYDSLPAEEEILFEEKVRFGCEYTVAWSYSAFCVLITIATMRCKKMVALSSTVHCLSQHNFKKHVEIESGNDSPLALHGAVVL